MKIGFVQLAPAFGDVDATIRILDGLRSDFERADLVVLPEMCNSGYNFTSIDQARSLAEDAQAGPFVRHVISLCKKHNQHIVVGINERDPQNSELYNTAVLLSPAGFVGKYRKLHLFMNEKNLFQPGDLGLPVFDIGPCKVGLQICFDWMFPEAWRVLALKGADIICHPANLVLLGRAQRAVPVHAMINRVFAITANRIGEEGELSFTGLSTMADPNGEVLAQASGSRAEVRIVDVDIALARNKKITPQNDVLADRRPEEYREPVEPKTHGGPPKVA